MNQTLPAYEIPTTPPRPPEGIDPNAPATTLGGLYGLGLTPHDSRLVAVPVPYDVTCSAHHGTLDGPRAVIEASMQVDLRDPLLGDVWRAGLCTLPELELLRVLSEATLERAEQARAGDDEARAAVDAMGREVWRWLELTSGALLDSGRTPLILGGEHGISLGAFRAVAARHPGFGILQIDAHADLRAAYEGWQSSHASVMARALELPQLACLVQAGLRDYCQEEQERSEQSQGRSIWFTDAQIAARLMNGESFRRVAEAIIAPLPSVVWISFDIDGLEPALCPQTGTPVPGGFTWREAQTLLLALHESGRRIVGCDLVEVGGGDWDGYVAAKLFYLLAGICRG